MTHGSLFSGIGGFDLAAEWMGWENVFHCEWNEFGQKVLKYYWPNAITYGDIKKTDFSIHRGSIDILTGGFPCQPYSLAGERKGKEDERHLWPEMLRAIKEIQPSWIVGENVFGLINWSGGLVFDEVQTDLESAGYEVWPYVLPACAVNAPHRRDRIWFVAHRIGNGGQNKPRCVGRQAREAKRKGEQPIYSVVECIGIERDDTNTEPTGLEGRNRLSKSMRPESGGEENATTHTNIIGRNNGSYNRSERYFQGNIGITPKDKSEWNGREFRISETCSIFTDTDCGERCERGMYSERPIEAERHISTRNSRIERSSWQNFPTQSPLCSRNDGVPPELAGITFSKHRNESIKAYGNAIVPQVAYQIFKAIEAYEANPSACQL